MQNEERERAGVSWSRGSFRRPHLVVLALIAILGCYKAQNYPDPSGPIYTGHHAAPSTIPRGEPGDSTSTVALGEGPLRVVTFNIAYGRQVDQALAVLQEEPALAAPDVLALQEMDAAGVERIARALKLDYVYSPSGLHPKYDRDFGCAILSPWPLEEHRKIVLPSGARITGLQRVVAVATLVRGSQRIRVYSVHLSSPLGISGDVRRQQVELLLADAQTSRDPVIIAGDFNSEDVGEILVEGGLVWPTREVGLTTDFLGFGFSYDHVFTKGLRLAPTDPAQGIIDDNRGASDHRPVWVLVEPE
jgi:endonuclease/exonuclease/phosphatase family metal-dependent hydrolase